MYSCKKMSTLVTCVKLKGLLQCKHVVVNIHHKISYFRKYLCQLPTLVHTLLICIEQTACLSPLSLVIPLYVAVWKKTILHYCSAIVHTLFPVYCFNVLQLFGKKLLVMMQTTTVWITFYFSKYPIISLIRPIKILTFFQLFGNCIFCKLAFLVFPIPMATI